MDSLDMHVQNGVGDQMSQCEIMIKSKDKWEKLKHKCIMEKEANGVVIRYERFAMCWFDPINSMVASMIAKGVNLPSNSPSKYRGC